MDIDKLEAELLRLPRATRARLAEFLISSLEPDSEIENAWVREAHARYRKILDGTDDPVDTSTVLAELRKNIDS